MAIIKLKNLEPADLDRIAWRYLTFSKFISLLSYGSIWFSKLKILEDEYEGGMPPTAMAAMSRSFEPFKKHFDPSLHYQFDAMHARNVEDGRELTVVNCWYLSDEESIQMWNEYGRDCEAVAIRSTVRQLQQSIFCDPQISHIGAVKYVDWNTHDMSLYEANQAQERAFIKRLSYAHENELRVATMSLRGPMCVGLDGEPLTPQDYNGAGMNNFDAPGLYVRADLHALIKEVILAPGCGSWFELLIKKILRDGGFVAPVRRSSL